MNKEVEEFVLMNGRLDSVNDVISFDSCDFPQVIEKLLDEYYNICCKSVKLVYEGREQTERLGMLKYHLMVLKEKYGIEV